MYQKLFLFKSEALKNKIIYFFILGGFLGGEAPDRNMGKKS